jgi:PhnB protein
MLEMANQNLTVMTDERSGFGIFLTFSGQCAQALTWYKKCFGGELLMQTMADEFRGQKLDERMKGIVVSATLTNNYFKMVATDLTGDCGVIIGNNISILVECATTTERSRLSTFLGAHANCHNDDKLICVLDRYNINWILSIK